MDEQEKKVQGEEVKAEKEETIDTEDALEENPEERPADSAALNIDAE